MKELIDSSKDFYFSDLLMTLITILCFFVSLRLRKKHKGLEYFFLYPLICLIQTSNIYIPTFFLSNSKFKYLIVEDNIATIIFLLIEFLIFFIYFNTILKSKTISYILKLLPIIYLISYVTLLYYFIYKNNESLFLFYMIQIAFFLTISILYLVELFIVPPIENLAESTSFWIFIAISLYFLCTSPIFISIQFIISENKFLVLKNLYSINYFSYAIMFILIIKAFKCKPTIIHFNN